jgi:hypothetical protein
VPCFGPIGDSDGYVLYQRVSSMLQQILNQPENIQDHLELFLDLPNGKIHPSESKQEIEVPCLVYIVTGQAADSSNAVEQRRQGKHHLEFSSGLTVCGWQAPALPRSKGEGS